jgi:hypothetical protein
MSGCSICCAPFDYDYGYTGGAWVRDNPSCGRVGSVFDPAGYKAIDDEAPTEGEPTPAERIEEDAPPANNMDPNLMPPPQAEAPNMISTPRLRAVRDYLPEN